MALLEKYSTLNANIESARNIISQIHTERRGIQDQIDAMLSSRQDMLNGTHAANDERGELQKRLKVAIRSYDALDDRRVEAQAELDEARREAMTVKRCGDESRRTFLESRRRFRSACRDVRGCCFCFCCCFRCFCLVLLLLLLLLLVLGRVGKVCCY